MSNEPRTLRNQRSTGSTTAVAAVSQRSKRVLTTAGAIGMLAVGALLGEIIPRGVGAIWPDPDVPPVQVIADQNSHFGEAYFAGTPDWTVLNREADECESHDYKDDLVTGGWRACYDAVIKKHGGVPTLGTANVEISNPQTQSVVITDVVAIVKERIPTRFAVFLDPPVGDSTGVRLAFNLDRDVSRAVRVGQNADARAALAGSPTPHFESERIEIPPMRTMSFLINGESAFEGVVEWHLEVSLVSQNADGDRERTTVVVRPTDGPFRGVPGSVRADTTVVSTSGEPKPTSG
jgi:hypothetical protein